MRGKKGLQTRGHPVRGWLLREEWPEILPVRTELLKPQETSAVLSGKNASPDPVVTIRTATYVTPRDLRPPRLQQYKGYAACQLAFGAP